MSLTHSKRGPGVVVDVLWGVGVVGLGLSHSEHGDTDVHGHVDAGVESRITRRDQGRGTQEEKTTQKAKDNCPKRF